VSLAFSALVHAAAGPIARAAGLGNLEDVVRCAAWILALDAVALVPFGELRLRHRAGMFAGVKTAGIVINIALNFVFVRELGLGAKGVFLAALAASSATLTLLAPVIAANLRPVFDKGLAKELGRFGLPLVPAGLASMVVQVIDRPILKAMTDDATVGLYQANYRLGIFMMMIVNMFDAAWRPFFLQKAEQPEAPKLFAQVLTLFCAGACLAALALSLFMRDIVALPLFAGKPLIHPSYWSGLGIVPIVLAGYLFNGLYVNFLAPVTIGKRTDLIAYAAGTGALVNVACNAALIPSMGIMGAAWATLAAYAAMAAALWLWGRKLYPVPYEWGKVAFLGAAALGLGFAGRSASFGVRLGLCAALPALAAGAGVFSAGGLTLLKAAWPRAK
jgi:O-antigen/teichoic acid export membrane protein